MLAFLRRNVIQFTSQWAYNVLLILTCMVISLCSVNVLPQKENYTPDYNIYHSLSHIDTAIQNLCSSYPKFIKFNTNFRSGENRPQHVLRITNFTHNTFMKNKKAKILFSYGEHAREFLPVESLLFLLKNLTAGLNTEADSYSKQFTRYILTHVDITVIVMSNPDGRHYVEKTHNYCWRGTKNGVDLNRNFDWEFGNEGSSGNPNDEEYRGFKPFSEPETEVYLEMSSVIQFDAFFSFHSGIKHIYIPYSDSNSRKLDRKPENIDKILELASLLSGSSKQVYKYGTSQELIGYTADGTIFDFMAGVRKIPFSYAIELWGKNHQGPSCFDLFNPENSKLQEVLVSLHPLYVQIFNYLIDWKSRNLPKELKDPMKEEPSLVFGYILLVFVIVITGTVALHKKVWCCRMISNKRRVVSLKTLGSSFSVKRT